MSNTFLPLATLALSLGVGCGGASSNDPNGITGSRAGRGGSAGAGGSARAGRGGSSGEAGRAGSNTAGDGGSMLVDAGSNEGGAAGSSAGGGGGYLGEEPPVPDGCPTPSFIPAPGQVISIQSVHFDRSEVVLRNVSDTPQTITGGRQGWQWCNVPGYWAVVIEEQDITLQPDQTLVFHLIERDSTLRKIFHGDDPGDTNELGIYTTTGAFNNSTLIEAFVSWGQGSMYETRESTATLGEKWNYGARITINPGDAGFVATGDARTGDGFTSVPDRCLPPR